MDRQIERLIYRQKIDKKVDRLINYSYQSPLLTIPSEDIIDESNASLMAFAAEHAASAKPCACGIA